jgi:threonine/homoserine/homoserine lactone efflux protein
MPAADVLSVEVSGALLGLWGTYLLGLLIPGPNFLVIAGAAALQGFRGALPLIVSIVAGTCLQVLVMVSAIALLPQGGIMELAGRFVGALTLIIVAIHLWRASAMPYQAARARPDRASVGVLAGLSIGLCNPITLGGIAAQLLGPSAVLIGSAWGLVAVLGIAVLGLLRSIVVARLFASAAVQSAILAMHRPIAGLVAVSFTVMSLMMLTSLVDTEAATGTPRHITKNQRHCLGAGIEITESSPAEFDRICDAAQALLAW